MQKMYLKGDIVNKEEFRMNRACESQGVFGNLHVMMGLRRS